MARRNEAFGLGEVVICLTDLQQRRLVALTEGLATLDIDASVAGWCYRTVSLRIEDADTGVLCLWLPVVDGAERLGVLGVRTHSVDAVRLRRCRMLTGIVAMAITSKRAYSDSFARRARVERMQLPAEMLRAFLPPRTIGNAHVVSTAVLEPAYEIGGDAFDHSLTQSTLHAAILDAMGHDLCLGPDDVGRACGLSQCPAGWCGAARPRRDHRPGPRPVAARQVLHRHPHPTRPGLGGVPLVQLRASAAGADPGRTRRGRGPRTHRPAAHGSPGQIQRRP